MPEDKFQVDLKRLEKIVRALETGELSLDESLKRYEEAVRLVGSCTQKLKNARTKIKVLSKKINQKLLTPLDEPENLQD